MTIGEAAPFTSGFALMNGMLFGAAASVILHLTGMAPGAVRVVLLLMNVTALGCYGYSWATFNRARRQMMAAQQLYLEACDRMNNALKHSPWNDNP